MLKTNSKIVKERIRQFILDNTTLENYDIDTTGWSWEQCAVKIREICLDEISGDYYCRTMSEQQRFEHWVKGLPSAFDCEFLYRTSAIDDLGKILEETDEEKSKYTERDAENLFINLIWREINNAYIKSLKGE